MTVMLTATALVAPPAMDGQAPSLTARQVLERIKANIGVPWMDQTVDTFKDGDPDTRVTGIAVTMMATLDVLQRAAAQGSNLVITHEPTFFGHPDELAPLETAHDSVTAVKRAFIREHLGQLAADIRDRLGAPTLRVLGDPKRRVSNVAMAPGFAGFSRHLVGLRRDDVQVLVIGEAHEWETVEYVADAVTAGMDKALIVIGHIPSEQAGMEDFAQWLAPLVRETTVHFVPAVDRFWFPK